MFIRFREKTAQRYGDMYGAGPSERECVGKCKNRPRYYARYGVGAMVKGRTFLEGCPMKPLCPLLQPRTRLEVSIVETRRADGKVRHEHVASLGSIADDTVAARELFWRECEARLARLANRLGPDLDRLRQAVAARVPPPTDADRASLDAWEWDRLESTWTGRAQSKARESSKWNETAKRVRREAVEAEANALQARRLRGNAQAYSALNLLLGVSLGEDAICTRRDEIKRQLKAWADEQERER
jgi:hypothetical protein